FPSACSPAGLPATHFGPRFSSTTYCFEGGWLCANNHPATAKAATIPPTHTIRESNIPSLYLFRPPSGFIHRSGRESGAKCGVSFPLQASGLGTPSKGKLTPCIGHNSVSGSQLPVLLTICSENRYHARWAFSVPVAADCFTLRGRTRARAVRICTLTCYFPRS